MTAVLHSVTPELPPCVGGVADYAARLAAYWPGKTPTDWWVAAGVVEAAQANPAWTVKMVPPNMFGVGWPDTGTLFVHYTQYGYAGGGIPWRLVVGLRRWRRKTKNVELRAESQNSNAQSHEVRRLVVFFHETWLEGPFWRRRGLATPFARECAHKLAHAADVVVTNCERHAAQLADVSEVTVLPVPSNVIPEGNPKAKGDEKEWARKKKLRVIIFGLPETRLRTLQAHQFFLAWLRVRGGLGELVLLGAGDEAHRFAVAGMRLATGLAGGAVRRVGTTDAAGVSAELYGADLGLSAYAADEVGKSGTLAAYFTHGCTVGCAGHNAGGIALDLSLGADDAPRDWASFWDADACAKREARVAAYVRSALNWSVHAARLAALVQKT